jgi:protein involved in polysaccharide export with SLBB domain
VDLDALLYGGRVEMNPEITQGDLIHIPVDLPVRIYVNGAVKAPGEFETRRSRPLTVLQAITKAGGPSERAALRKVELLRRAADGSQAAIPVDLKAVMKGNAEDPVLQDGDVVVVPETYF